MIFSVLTPDGQLGFASNEGTNAVQTYAFKGGTIQIRYTLDGVIESRAFIDDSWSEWNPLVTAAGDGLEADSSGTVSVDNTVVRTTRSITAGTGLTGGGGLSADREIALDSASQAALGLAESAVQPTRSITTGAGLTGGGTLAADRELAIAEGGVTPTLTQRLQARAVTANTTLALGDVDSVVEVNSASARSVTVPTNASAPLPIGAVIEIVRWGAGAVTISPASGVTLRSPDDARDIATQYGSAFLRKRDTDEWHLSGDLE